MSLNKGLFGNTGKSDMGNDNYSLVKQVIASEPQDVNKREQASEFVSKID